jgi:hypothetical protein
MQTYVCSYFLFCVILLIEYEYREQCATMSSIMRALLQSKHEYQILGLESSLLSIPQQIIQLSKAGRECEECNAMENETKETRLAALKEKLVELQHAQQSCTRQAKFLKSLHYPEMYRRWDQIVQSEKSSDEWIFDTEKTSFVSWLNDNGQQGNLFHIFGKV